MILSRKRIKNKSYTNIAVRLIFVSCLIWFGMWLWVFRGRIVLSIHWDKLPLGGRLGSVSWGDLLMYDITWYGIGCLWLIATISATVFGLWSGIKSAIKFFSCVCVWSAVVVSIIVWISLVIVLLMDIFLWPCNSHFIDTPFFGVRKLIWTDLELRVLLDRELYRHGFNHPGKLPVSKDMFEYILYHSGPYPEGFSKVITRCARRLANQEILDQYIWMEGPI